jgi:hypothetical protein
MKTGRIRYTLKWTKQSKNVNMTTNCVRKGEEE